MIPTFWSHKVLAFNKRTYCLAEVSGVLAEKWRTLGPYYLKVYTSGRLNMEMVVYTSGRIGIGFERCAGRLVNGPQDWTIDLLTVQSNTRCRVELRSLHEYANHGSEPFLALFPA